MSDPMSGQNGLMPWLSDRLGKIDWALGDLHAQITMNRQITLEFARHVTGRMDHITTRMDTLKDSKNGRHSLIKHFLSMRALIYTSLFILFLTGHISVPEIKELIKNSMFLR